MAVMVNCIVLLEPRRALGIPAFDTIEVGIAPVPSSHGLNHGGCRGSGEERPVVVRCTRGRVGERTELSRGWDNVDEDRSFDDRTGGFVDEHTMAYTTAAVVAAPDDGS